MDKGFIIVISGPSGVGKGTLVGELLKNSDDFALSISATTRQPREGEVHGVNYFYITKEEFLDKVNNNGMLEYAQYNGNYYGTPREYVESTTQNGKNIILEIEVQGAKKIQDMGLSVVTIFVMPPSWEVLKKRLMGRGTETEDVIENRLNIAKEEMTQADKYDYIVINDHLPDCVEDIKKIIDSEKWKRNNMLNFVEGVLNDANA
ncbi:MAG: guanylate kinase [Acutalibacteraceae bacterium]